MNVCLWHEAEIQSALANVRFLTQSGRARTLRLSKKQLLRHDGLWEIASENVRIFRMIWKRIKEAWEPSDQTWKQIDQTPIPLSTMRIWLADKDGKVTRAMAWTWPILKRREPRKYRWWMSRANHAREPTPEALASLNALNQAADN